VDAVDAGGRRAGRKPQSVSVPMTPFAPGRLSTTMLWPSAPARRSVTTRAITSSVLPLVKGQIMRMCRTG
jgi:hypothetical protein